MTKLNVTWVPVLVLGVVGCARGEDPPGATREPLARQAPIVTAAAPATPPPPANAPARTESKPAALAVKPPTSLAKKPAKASEPAVAGDGLVIKRLVVTNSIAQREPAPVDRLTLSDEQLVAFLEVSNPSDSPEQIVVTFESGGRSVGHVKLEVPAKSTRWRTWGKTRQVRQSGEWVAVVRSGDGTELSRKSFAMAP